MKKNFITGLAILFGTAMTINLSACGGDSSTSADEKNPQNQENTETEDNSSDNKSNTSSNSSKTNSSSNTTTSSSSSQKTSVNLDPVKSGSLVDERDGQSYRTVQIGTQIWMAENMKLDVSDGFCYGDIKENCEKYGTFYNSNTALRICPEGWSLPTEDDWVILAENIGTEKSDKYGGGTFGYNNDAAISTIRSTDGWNNSNGTNSLGFSAYPTGYFNGTQYSGLGEKAYFMGKYTASEDASWAYISENEIYVTAGKKATSAAMPVRCMQEIPCDATNDGEVKGTVICRKGKWEKGSELEIATNFKSCDATNVGEMLNGYICRALINGTWKWIEPTEIEIATDFKSCTADNEGELYNGYICVYNDYMGMTMSSWRKPTLEEAVGSKECNNDNIGEILNGYVCTPCPIANCASVWRSTDSIFVDASKNTYYYIYHDGKDSYFTINSIGSDWETAMISCPEGWHVPAYDSEKRYPTSDPFWTSTEVNADSAWSISKQTSKVTVKTDRLPTICYKDKL